MIHQIKDQFKATFQGHICHYSDSSCFLSSCVARVFKGKDRLQGLHEMILTGNNLFYYPSIIMVSFCDYCVHRALSILFKQHLLLNKWVKVDNFARDVPCMKAFKIYAKKSVPCKILVAMATKRKSLKTLFPVELYKDSSNYFSGIKIRVTFPVQHVSSTCLKFNIY